MKRLMILLGAGILLSGCASISPQKQELSQPAAQMQKAQTSPPVVQKAPGIQEMSSQIFEENQNCNGKGPMLVVLSPSLPISGKIIAFVPPSVANRLILRTEQHTNGKIDPRYKENLRVVVHPDGYPPYRRVIVLVPSGMNVHLGEQVTYVGGHASPQLACHYIPNLIAAP